MDLTPPVVHNDASVAKKLKVYGEICDSGDTEHFRAEDFANIWSTFQDVSSLLEQVVHEWHHPAFLVDDAALPFAIQYFVDNTNALLGTFYRKETRNKKWW